MIHIHCPGHGGVDEKGIYTSCPTYNPEDPDTWYKMHVFDNKNPIFEGELNRHIVDKVIEESNKKGIKAVNLLESFPRAGLKSTEPDDLSLYKREERLHILKNFYNEECVLWEHHCNAFKHGTTGANGYETYSSERDNFSDTMQHIFEKYAQEYMGNMRYRGDKDKDFYLIDNSPIYGILIEWFFFDNKKEVEWHMSNKGMQAKAEVMKKSQLETEKQWETIQ